VFDSDEELVLLIKKINPDVMIVGSDWKNKKVIGSEYAKSVKFFERIPKYSTTKIISSIAAGRNLS
jgi:bifunctional ADP-heptose synthase (sugar kinase/adenylyltransferase)